ncbi:MAG: 50S ribosomal protein L4 [Clostridia bacterium]|nr:50S ribosomal protein L4 [Clostridia bacterium]MBR6516998.1 50S ribosomal protein L4 [Bacilli bacterium]
MTKISVKNIKGEVVKEINLDSKIWDIEVNDDALKKMIRLQLDSMRQGTRKTKTRSEVSGGGRKPWKQKGTGRARQGSIRAVQWRGGGIAFGVNPRNFTFKINKKERVLALLTALTYKNKEKSLVVLDNIKLDTLKTKEITNILNALELSGKVLFVTKDESENLYMASRNLGNVLVLMADEINCYDIVNADVMVVEEAALSTIEEVLK